MAVHRVVFTQQLAANKTLKMIVKYFINYFHRLLRKNQLIKPSIDFTKKLFSTVNGFNHRKQTLISCSSFALSLSLILIFYLAFISFFFKCNRVCIRSFALSLLYCCIYHIQASVREVV